MTAGSIFRSEISSGGLTIEFAIGPRTDGRRGEAPPVGRP
jgi:hypothetical protein